MTHDIWKLMRQSSIPQFQDNRLNSAKKKNGRCQLCLARSCEVCTFRDSPKLACKCYVTKRELSVPQTVFGKQARLSWKYWVDLIGVSEKSPCVIGVSSLDVPIPIVLKTGIGTAVGHDKPEKGRQLYCAGCRKNLPHANYDTERKGKSCPNDARHRFCGCLSMTSQYLQSAH